MLLLWFFKQDSIWISCHSCFTTKRAPNLKNASLKTCDKLRVLLDVLNGLSIQKETIKLCLCLCFNQDIVLNKSFDLVKKLYFICLRLLSFWNEQCFKHYVKGFQHLLVINLQIKTHNNRKSISDQIIKGWCWGLRTILAHSFLKISNYFVRFISLFFKTNDFRLKFAHFRCLLV